MDSEEKNSIDVGAGWIKTDKNGNKYTSMQLDVQILMDWLSANTGQTKLPCNLFRNKFKQENSNQPDCRLIISIPKS